MKFILSLMLFILYSYNSHAFNIYRCNSETRIELAMCGHYSTCINNNTGQSITKKIIDVSPSTSTYTIVTTDKDITIKRDFDGFLMERFDKEIVQRWRNDAQQVMAIGTTMGTLVINNGEFYYLSGLPMGIIATGTCKLQ